MSKKALKRAVDKVGGQSALARLVGVKQPVVANWLRRRLPAERVLSVESLTGIPRSELRPDLYPKE